jgi:hypothetical protein
VAEPTPVEPVRYEAHIKLLFRRRDQQSMKWAFDLWSYDDASRSVGHYIRKIRTSYGIERRRGAGCLT